MRDNRILCAALAAVLMLSGCSLINEDSVVDDTPAETRKIVTAQPDSQTEEETDPLLEPEKVVVTYMRAANAEFDRSMTKLMTDAYAAKYEYTKENMGHDHDYEGEHEEQDFKYEFDHEKSGFIDWVNVEEDYIKACEIYITVTYGEDQQPVSQYLVLIQDEEDKKWKICFAGSKQQAYTEGLIKDERSEKALDSAKAVYEAVSAVHDELASDEEYEFKFINYISTEDDEFVNRIKDTLPEELKTSYFTVFLDGQELDHIVWGESIDSDLMVTYPTEDKKAK